MHAPCDPILVHVKQAGQNSSSAPKHMIVRGQMVDILERPPDRDLVFSSIKVSQLEGPQSLNITNHYLTSLQ